jgi:dTDP-4-amino-4,6-dideoxygalactose transaminase
MAWGLRPGDAVFVPTLSFASSAEVVLWLGATPVFTDVDPVTFTMDAASLEAGIAVAERAGLRPAAIMPVDLFGHPADYDAIRPISEAAGLPILCDAAQGFGGRYRNARVGTLGHATTTSFFPAKPLGCYGDGGAIFTDDDALADVLLSLRVHGQGTNKYDNVRVGMNSRLDTLQAAILLEKLAVFEEEISSRNLVAQRYGDGLSDAFVTPRVSSGCESVWAQYTVRLEAEKRTEFQNFLKERGVPTAIYYPIALHRQTAYAKHPTSGDLSNSEALCRQVISLPMHPYLGRETQDRIVAEANLAAERLELVRVADC